MTNTIKTTYLEYEDTINVEDQKLIDVLTDAAGYTERTQPKI